MRWAMRKYKRLRGHPERTWRFLAAIAERERSLFAHWGMARGRRLDDRSPVSREAHAGICERRGCNSPRRLNPSLLRRRLLGGGPARLDGAFGSTQD